MTAILHIPHASSEIPAGVRDSFRLPDKELGRELGRMTDWFTDELFVVEEALARRVVYPISRLVVDPERFVDDADEPMSTVGMGVVYTKTSQGDNLRRELSGEERASLIGQYYKPHHRRFLQAVDDALEVHGRCLIVDCHSFPSVPLQCELDQSPDRPDICIGTDQFHTPEWLSSLAVDLFRDRGLRVEVNRPYSGAIVPLAHYRKNPNVLSVLVEIRRDLYMDEGRGRKKSDFKNVRLMVSEVLERILGTDY